MTLKTVTHVTKDDMPDWVLEVAMQLGEQEGITLEQAVRLMLYQGAVYYAEKIHKKRLLEE